MYDKIEDKILLFLGEAEFKKVVRGGKVKRKLICPPGYKAVDGRCEKMSPQELLKRKKAAKATQRKLKAQSGKFQKALKKRSKSLRRRAMVVPDNATQPGQQTEEK